MGRIGEASILSAVEKLEGDLVRIRAEGLDDLRRILGQGRGSSRVETLSEDVFHKILEILFRIVRTEKPAYARATKLNSRTSAASRLTTASTALRLVVEVAGQKLKHKTVNAVLDHIVDTLPTPNDGFCTPIETDYLKVFRSILEHAPHAEHLRPKQWQTYVDFALDGVEMGLQDAGEDEASLPSRQASATPRTGTSMSLRISQSSNNKSDLPIANSHVDELLGSLKCLTGISNAPLASRVDKISDSMIRWIGASQRSLEGAFEVLNNMLPLLLTENILLASAIFNQIADSVRRLWNSRSPTLRTHMLVTLFFLRHVYSNTTWEPRLTAASLLDSLVTVIWTELEKRSDRDALLLDDVSFIDVRNPFPMSLKGISPISDSTRIATVWSTLSVLASLVVGLASQRRADELENEPASPRKRRKLENSIEDIVHHATNSTGQPRIAAIQLILFVVDKLDDVPTHILRQICALDSCLTEDDPTTGSWLFVLLARCSMTKEAMSLENRDCWQRAWYQASRVLSSTAYCRSACYLMRQLLVSGVMKSLLSGQNVSESIFSDDRNGPGSFADTALMLFTTVLDAGLLESDRLVKHFTSRSLNWLELHWTIPLVPDRLHNSQLALFGQPYLLHTLLFSMMGQRSKLQCPVTAIPVGTIYMAGFIDEQDLSFTRYLVQDHHVSADARKSNVADSRKAPTSLSGQAYQSMVSIGDFLLSRIKSFHQAWKTLIGERGSNINTDIIEIAVTACVLGITVWSNQNIKDSIDGPPPSLTAFWKDILGFCLQRTGETLQNMTTKIGSRITQLESLDAAEMQSLVAARSELVEGTLNLVSHFSEIQDNPAMDPDLMDSLDTRTSQTSQARSIGMGPEVARQDLPQPADLRTSFAQMTLQLRLESIKVQPPELADAEVFATVVDELVSLDAETLLLSRATIVALFETTVVIRRVDACRLLERLAEVCLRDDQFERCEAALCFCLRVMTCLSSLWTTEEEDDLTERAYDIYDWYLNVALNKSIASKHVLFSMSTLSREVLLRNASYGTSDGPQSLPSPRTAMLKILSLGQNSVKFHMTPYLSRLFDGYVLGEHTAVFDDIVENLPTDPDNLEGIAVRLYVLAYLGARWHTILRQAIYHIFETSANVSSAMYSARKCTEMMCTHLKQDSNQALMRQFSSQILYTWLEKDSIDMMPYKAFGYSSLVELLQDMRDELVAQVAMRASSELAQQASQYLGLPWQSLIEASFPRVIAYAIIADASIHRSSQEVGKSESFVLEQLGEDRYASLIHQTFPEALAIVMVRLADDRGFEKVFGDTVTNDPAAMIFQKICQFSSSDMQLPPGQQPSFRAKHLLFILDRLFLHAQVPWEQIQVSAVTVSAFRTLIDDAKLAYGPLHACAVLRKIRILVSLTGKVVTTGYPLEMLLHNLRPFLTQFHCSEDAVGIFWYLLEQGKPFLQSRLPFTTGLGVSIFASLSEFVTAAQDSTTQESHYLSTMSKAQDFRKWLGGYLSGLDTGALKESTVNTFNNIIDSAKQITKNGNSSKNSAEGSLMYHLLVDQASDESLLSKASFRLTLRSLSHEFVPAADPREDILFDDQDVIKLTPILWSILNDLEGQKKFRIWAAEALGRAYALQGPETTLPATSDAKSPMIVSLQREAHDTYNRIITILFDRLWVDDRMSASTAEHTLQTIFSSIPRKERKLVLGSSLQDELFDSLQFHDYQCPRFVTMPSSHKVLNSVTMQPEDTCEIWASKLAVDMCKKSPEDPVLSSLTHILQIIPDLATTLLPPIVHILLVSEINGHQNVRESLSTLFMQVLAEQDSFLRDRALLVLDVVLYLRQCVTPSEAAMSQRNAWLTIDFEVAADAATKCDSYRTALLLLEIHASQLTLTTSRASRRSSASQQIASPDLVAKIYRNIDDPDFFYGTLQEADITSIVEKLCHEGAGYKALSFQSALLDSNIRSSGMASMSQKTSFDTAKALSVANFNGLAYSFKQASSNPSLESFTGADLRSSMNLNQWEIRQNSAVGGNDSFIANAFRMLSSSTNIATIRNTADEGILHLANQVGTMSGRMSKPTQQCSSLAVLAEIKETLSAHTYEDLGNCLKKHCDLPVWTRQTSFENVEQLLLGREALYGSIKSNGHLQNTFGLSKAQGLLMEVKALRTSLSLGHAHEMSQFCLNRAAYLYELMPLATQLGLNVQAAVQYDLANTLWAQDEAPTAIRILENLRSRSDLKDQAILVSQSEVLADLGQKLTEARLDRPDEVTSQYLQPAIQALDNQVTGSEAGRVYHNFAAFCDHQLRDPDNLDEYSRIEKLRNRKKQEVEELEAMKKGKEGKERDQIRSHLTKAQTWFKLDEQEWKRMKKHREELIEVCLKNYLRAMRACEDFPNDVLRFLALWLEQSANEGANATVSNCLPEVPSIKFAPLMNQLSSRILHNTDTFQRLLFDLMFRICNEHPFHSLHQVFATSKSKGQKNDTVATSRYTAATKLAEAVMKRGSASATWIAIHNSNIGFVRIATDRIPEKEVKTGSKFPFRKLPTGARLEQTIQDLHQKIPPPTMKIPLRADRDYASVPTLTGFGPYITIAGGVSAPKIVTAMASDGTEHKMLLKGGNDDLRQDSIMEQVFEQVSNLLRDHRATRQRHLGIRTYKVIPLTHNAGIIEFVKNTMPLHDYVLPAHTRYFPKDYKPNRCRKEISDAQTKSLAQRLQAYRNVAANFHPVMRFFFMEHFLDPDDWFQKRLNYSRSSAAISMLGHVLGLGDRHGHNILLDTTTGEVVHIDLGVAFEAGRVLPVPEVVPFRLTRDLVDGMGLSGVEGVFRQCCNFTLEALRQDQEAIMTILDVLRWDPLYSWSVSPLRLQRMQENEEQAANADSTAGGANDAGLPGGTGLGGGAKLDHNEPSEADRALAVVARKLGKSLSVEATVNELIRQAMDERNLAVLYCGWAAYA